MVSIPAVPPDALHAEQAFQTDQRWHQFPFRILPVGRRWESLFADRFVWLPIKTS